MFSIEILNTSCYHYVWFDYSLKGFILTISIADDWIFSIPLNASHVKNPVSWTSSLLILKRDPMAFLCLGEYRFTDILGFVFFSPTPPGSLLTSTSFMNHWIRIGGGSPDTSQRSLTEVPESLVMLTSGRTKWRLPVNKRNIVLLIAI